MHLGALANLPIACNLPIREGSVVPKRRGENALEGGHDTCVFPQSEIERD